MKARVVDNSFDIMKKIKQEASKSDEIDELYFYRNMHEALDGLYKLYKDGYDETRVFRDITKDLSEKERAREFVRLEALQCSILSLLVGLNRESLQEANSKTEERSLFQYLNYQSSASVNLGGGKFVSSDKYSKMLSDYYGFNKSQNGPFPYMLEILKTDKKTRPYDCVAKIRNAVQHAEYYQKKGEINKIHITNHNDDGDLTFEGNLLLWTYRLFVEDFFGIGLGVTDKFHFFDLPPVNSISNKEELINYLKDTSCISVRFTKVPEKYKFSGQDALYAELNKCFAIDHSESKNVENTLATLNKEGVEYTTNIEKLTDETIGKIVEYLEETYKDKLYNVENVFNKISSIVKLVHSPNYEISNCLNNILRYIDMKKKYLSMGQFNDSFIFDEQHYDKDVSLAFQYTLMLIKANIVSYALECSKFECPELDKINISKVNVFPQTEYVQRVTDDYVKSGDANISTSFVVLDGIRNALAHGHNRIIIMPGKDKNIYLSDTFDPKHKLHISGSLNGFEEILSNTCFLPDNIKIKKAEKVKTKIQIFD